MKILFVGDVVGEPGRKAVKELVPILRQEHALDVVIANGENAAGGAGITPKIAEELYDYGVDVITTGDHLWDQKEVNALLETESRFLRPLNYPAGTLGHGSQIFHTRSGQRYGVLNLQGRTFMPPLENPFTLAQIEVGRLRQHAQVVVVDFHAEATSEKIALARMLDGQVSAVIGTHTHVQTADEQIFEGGTAFLCDAGFTGAQRSVLGREIEPIIQRFLTCAPQRFYVARERVMLHGALLDIDDSTGRARTIERIGRSLLAPQP